MNFNIKNLNIKIRGNDKKEIFKIFMILILVNILMAVITVLFANVEILKTIILYSMSAVYIGTAIYILKKENQKTESSVKEVFENKYDPILTSFLIKNEFVLDNALLNAYIYYLIEQEHIEVDKEKQILKLKDRARFVQIGALEKINDTNIKDFSSDEIPSYENMFIGKILFAFHDEIDLNEFRRNKIQNYYLQRGEMCKILIEKMILYEIQKRNMMGRANKDITIVGILNIITSIVLFIIIGRLNFVFIIANIINILLSALIIKGEKIWDYHYSEDVEAYIYNLLEYVNTLNKTEKKVENNDKNIEKDKDKELKLLFEIENGEDLFK